MPVNNPFPPNTPGNETLPTENSFTASKLPQSTDNVNPAQKSKEQIINEALDAAGIDTRREVEKVVEKQQRYVANTQNMLENGVITPEQYQKTVDKANSLIEQAERRQVNLDYQSTDEDSRRTRQRALKDEKTARAVELAERLAETKGIAVKYFADSKAEAANGMIKDGIMYINVAYPSVIFKTAVHEAIHHLKSNNKNSFEMLYGSIERLANSNTQFNRLWAATARAYSEYYGENVTGKEITEEIVCKLSEELVKEPESFFEKVSHDRGVIERFLDIIRGIKNNIAITFTKSEIAMLDEAERRLVNYLRGEAGTAESSSKTKSKGHSTSPISKDNIEQPYKKSNTQNGKKEKLSLNIKFPQQFDAWDKDKSRNGYFVIGTTSKALESIGINPATISWDKQKIAKIMAEHPEMTGDVIKQVPQILEHPVVVMQSLTRFNRVIALGEVYGKDGTPVLCALELLPNGQIDNLVKIASAYGKKEKGLQSLIQQSDILYLDPNKKRTDSWLKALRLQLPSGLTNYGSIGMVTYYTPESNTQNEESKKSLKINPTEQDGTFDKTAAEYVDSIVEKVNGRTAKSVKLQKQFENVLRDRVAEIFSVPWFEKNAVLGKMVRDISERVKEKGYITKAEAEDLFNTAYNMGRNTNSEFYDQYKGLKDEIRRARIAPLSGSSFEQFKLVQTCIKYIVLI